jgi:hypothetical protein
MNKWAIAVLIFGALTGTGTSVRAEEGACKADVEKFCANVQPGEGRIAQCLKTHQGELSPACRLHGQEMKTKVKAAREEIYAACYDDQQKLCSGIQPGEGRVANCLKQNQAQLSAGCQTKLAEIKERRQTREPKKK